MTENKICIYDNHTAFRREYWRDGKLVGWYTKEFLDQADNILTITKKMEVHIRKFNTGALIGDEGAIKC